MNINTLALFIALMSWNFLSGQELQPDFPTYTLTGTENAEALAVERVNAINEMIWAEAKPASSKVEYGLRWQEKKLTLHLHKYGTTSKFLLEPDMYVKMTKTKYNNINFVYKNPSRQVYNGFLKSYSGKYGTSLKTEESALRFCAYVRDIVKLANTSSLKGLQLTKVGRVAPKKSTREQKNDKVTGNPKIEGYGNALDVDRIALANERLKAINELFQYEYEDDRQVFSMKGIYRVGVKGASGCNQTIENLRNASYLFTAKEECGHQIKLDVDKYGTITCPLEGEHVMLFKFTNKEIAQLFQTYISDVQKIIFDHTLDINSLHPDQSYPRSYPNQR